MIRKVYEETGYRVRVNSDIPVHIAENRFYHIWNKEFCHALINIYEVELVSEKQNLDIINMVDGDEIEKVEWVRKEDLNEKNCHPLFWGVVRGYEADSTEKKVKN